MMETYVRNRGGQRVLSRRFHARQSRPFHCGYIRMILVRVGGPGDTHKAIDMISGSPENRGGDLESGHDYILTKRLTRWASHAKDTHERRQ